MLKINPVARPDCASIIQRIEKLGKVPQNIKAEVPATHSDHNLLGTIAIPKDLRHLENVLPESKYENSRFLHRDDSASKIYISENKPNKSSSFQ